MDLHERIAELESKLESSVAHNLALRKFITDSCYVFEGEQSDYSDAYVTADEYMPLNPAAGAEIINALRAEGINEFCGLLEKYGKVEPHNFNPLFADLYAKISKRIYDSILDNPCVYDLASLVDWLERGTDDSRAYADMAIKRAAQLRNGEHVGEEGV